MAENLPTSKTGSAIRKQALVVAANVLATRRGAPGEARYDGHTSCPVVTAHNRMLLAEFDYTLTPRPGSRSSTPCAPATTCTCSNATGWPSCTGTACSAPVSIFATVLGLGGAALAWQRGASALDLSAVPGRVLAWTALAVFAVVSIAHATKTIRYPAAVRREWRHPVMLALPFTLSAWAYTFPIAALTSALLTAARAGAAGYRIAAALALTVVSLLVTALTVHILVAVGHGQLCRPEPPPHAVQGTTP